MKIEQATARDILSALQRLAGYEPERPVGHIQNLTVKQAIKMLKQAEPSTLGAAVFAEHTDRPVLAAFSIQGKGIFLLGEFTSTEGELMVEAYVTAEEKKDHGITGNDTE